MAVHGMNDMTKIDGEFEKDLKMDERCHVTCYNEYAGMFIDEGDREGQGKGEAVHGMNDMTKMGGDF